MLYSYLKLIKYFFITLLFILIQSNLTQAKVKITGKIDYLFLTQNTTEINNNNLKKITFDISQISKEGLIGNEDSLRSLSYEFCIPKNDKYLAQIKQIDSEITISHSRGRIGCTENQYLCIGDTHKPNWKEILMAIADLNYVERIDQFFGE